MAAADSTLIRAGQFVQVARQGGIILVALALPRLGLGREEIGEWEGLLYLGYILGFGWISGLLQAYLVTVRTSRDAKLYSRKVMWSVIAASAILLAVAAGLHQWVFAVLNLGSPPVGWWFFLIFLLSHWPSIFFEQVLQLRGKPWPLIGFGTFSALGFAFAILWPLYQGGDLENSLRWLAAFAGLKAVIMGVWLIFDGRKPGDTALPPVRGKENEAGVRSLWKTARPLIAYATIGGLVTAFDPWFVNYWYEDDEGLFAIFRYGARELPFVAAVVNGMVVVVLPRLTEDVGGGLTQLRESSRKLFHWIFIGTILLMVTAPFWWVPVFTDLFAEGLPLFRLYLFMTIGRLLFPMPVLVALGHTRGLWLFSLSELAMNIVLCLLLAPALGLLGIVLATVLSDIVNNGILMYYLYRKSGIEPNRYMDLRVFGGYSVLLALGYWLM